MFLVINENMHSTYIFLFIYRLLNVKLVTQVVFSYLLPVHKVNVMNYFINLQSQRQLHDCKFVKQKKIATWEVITLMQICYQAWAVFATAKNRVRIFDTQLLFTIAVLQTISFGHRPNH